MNLKSSDQLVFLNLFAYEGMKQNFITIVYWVSWGAALHVSLIYVGTMYNCEEQV